MLWPLVETLLITGVGLWWIVCLGFDVRAKHRPFVN